MHYTLSAYGYHIEFKLGSQNSNADLLSCLPLPEEPAEVRLPGETILLMENLQALPVTSAHGLTETPPSPRCGTMSYKGGSTQTRSTCSPTRDTRMNSAWNWVRLWGRRVVVPPQGGAKVLELVHEGHPRASRMKDLARCHGKFNPPQIYPPRIKYSSAKYPYPSVEYPLKYVFQCRLQCM